MSGEPEGKFAHASVYAGARKLCSKVLLHLAHVLLLCTSVKMSDDCFIVIFIGCFLIVLCEF